MEETGKHDKGRLMLYNGFKKDNGNPIKKEEYR